MGDTNTTGLSLTPLDTGYTNSVENTAALCFVGQPGFLIFAGVCMAICLGGLAGNGMVVWFLGFNMKKNPFTVYILNLAVADFSVLLLSFLVLLVNFSVQEVCFHYSNAIFLFYWWVDVPYCCFQLTGLSFLTAICTERCISVLFPIWYRCSRPMHLSCIVCCVLWACSVLFTFLIVLSCSDPYELICKKAFEGIIAAVLIIFSSLLLLSNLILFIKLRCGSQKRHPRRLFVAILLNILFFFVFGIPYGVHHLFLFFHSYKLIPNNPAFLLAALNCSINPVIYFLVGSYRQRRFEASVKVAFRRVFAEKTMCEERSQDLRDTAAESSV